METRCCSMEVDGAMMPEQAESWNEGWSARLAVLCPFARMSIDIIVLYNAGAIVFGTDPTASRQRSSSFGALARNIPLDGIDLEQGDRRDRPFRAHQSWKYPWKIRRHDHYCKWVRNVSLTTMSSFSCWLACASLAFLGCFWMAMWPCS